MQTAAPTTARDEPWGAGPSALTTPGRVPPEPLHRRTGWTLTTYYWTAALVWSAVVTLAFLPVHLLETFVFKLQGTPWSMVWNPFEFATRIVGLAHFVIAVLFQVRRLPLRTSATWLWLVAMLALSAVFSIAFTSAGATANPLAVILFYLLFLIHSSRDEVLFYDYYSGKAVSAREGGHRDTRWLQVGMAGALGLLVPAAVLVVRLTGEGRLPTWLTAARVRLKPKEVAALATVLPPDWTLTTTLLVTGVPWVILLAVGLFQLHAGEGGYRGLWARYTPLVKVFGLTLVAVYASVLHGAGTLYLIVLMHFVAWFQFTLVKLHRIPEAVHRSITIQEPLRWFLGTPRGFIVLHVGLSGFFLTLIAFNQYVLAQAPIRWGAITVPNPLTLLFSSQVFYYWTIVHVMLSFVPKQPSVRM